MSLAVRTSPATVERTSTEVMSCDASIIVVGGSAGAGAQAIRRLHELEQRWSRFLPNSEVSQLNRSGGRPIIVSSDTTRLVETMVEAWHVTHGAYDPTLLRPLVEAGYRTSRTDDRHSTDLDPRVDHRGQPGRIRLDAAADVIQLPLGTAIDPGGIGKGLAADIVLDELLEAGAAGALVEIGGDLAVRGRAPDHDAWTINVAEGPDDPHPPSMVLLIDGGIATSTTQRRRWNTSGEEHHHLIDVDTLASSITSVRTCSVIAGSAAMAEAFTKVAFGQPPAATVAAFDQNQLAGRLRLHSGRLVTSEAWNRFEWKAAS